MGILESRIRKLERGSGEHGVRPVVCVQVDGHDHEDVSAFLASQGVREGLLQPVIVFGAFKRAGGAPAGREMRIV